MKKFIVLALALSITMLKAMSIHLDDNGKLAIRRNWSKTQDLLLLCNLGQNGQFNFSAAGLVSKKAADEDVLKNGKFQFKFHMCGDAVGVMYLYPAPPKPDMYILSGNHGFVGSVITLPEHNFQAADIGKPYDKKHWIAKINSKDEITVLPAVTKKDLPKKTKFRSSGNFKATRIISRQYLLDGKALEVGKIMRGKELAVIEKNGICRFDALVKAKFQHDKVEDFYAVYDIGYHFYPDGSCRIDTAITFPQDTCIRSINPVQDHDLLLPGGWFYEKYIPKMKPIQEKPEYSFSGEIKPQVFHRPEKKRVPDTNFYDFAKVQDMTAVRKTAAAKASRFEIKVNGGYVDPQNQPDRFIEFIGKNVKGKRQRVIGNVLGIDPEYGIAQKHERAKNTNSFTLASWHKTYITQFGQNETVFKAGTVLRSVGYRCYFNPANIGEATSLYTITHPDGKKLYVDFHKPVKDYLLPFAADAEVKILERSSGVELNGNKISVSGDYGFAVIFIPNN